MPMSTIGLLNGPNLDRLGKREPQIYGSASLQDVVGALQQLAAGNGCQIDAFQSNHEGKLIDQIHAWTDAGLAHVIINPGGLTHTSVALRDAIAASGMRFIEVHISNIHQREEFRHHSFTAAACVGQICGLGTYGYTAALLKILDEIKAT